MILHGDNIKLLKTIADNSIDSIVTDPPYGLKFMSKKWDYDVPTETVWRECLRVLKPGGHLLAFSSARTYHRMVVRIEDAGFEIRDQIMWIYGSGMPKSKNLSDDFQGWGTGLKPAHEPIVMARKPLAEKSVAFNMLTWKVGAINIDACRIPSTGGKERVNEPSSDSIYRENGSTNFGLKPGPRGGSPKGRWPTNIIHDGSSIVLESFPDAKGQQGDITGDEFSSPVKNCYGAMKRGQSFKKRVEDNLSAARFFYCAKASRAERNLGCDSLESKPLNWSSGEQSIGTFQSQNTNRYSENHHPTVKPLELMRYLIRLVTPKHGTTLDIYGGSGSSAVAAVLEDVNYIIMEREEEYLPIINARVAHAEQLREEEKVFSVKHPTLFDFNNEINNATQCIEAIKGIRK